MSKFLASDADREAHAAILQLEGLYPSTFDRGDFTGWAQLYTPDGAFDHLAIGDYPGSVIKGHDALAGFAEMVFGIWQGVHIPGLPGIEVDGDQATAFVPFQWSGIRRASSSFTATRRVSGYYDVHYEKTSEGWRIAYRKEKGTCYVTTEDFDIF